MKSVDGCERCWPSEADAAWEARRKLACAVELVDESHFHVMILACPSCEQRFLSVFTETIDWVAALELLGVDHLDASAAERTLGSVLKYRDDQEHVTEQGLDRLVGTDA